MTSSVVPPGVTRLLLVRHGETVATTRGLIAGRLDVALSPRGIEQARAAATSLSKVPLSAIYASTSRRALDSAEPIARPRGLEHTPDPDLCEIDFGAFEGLTFEEAAELFPDVTARWLSTPHEVAFPGGECLATLRRRALRSLRRIVVRHESGIVAIVCHAGPIQAIVGAVLGIPAEKSLRSPCGYGSVTLLDVRGDLPLGDP